MVSPNYDILRPEGPPEQGCNLYQRPPKDVKQQFSLFSFLLHMRPKLTANKATARAKRIEPQGFFEKFDFTVRGSTASIKFSKKSLDLQHL